LRKTKEDNKIKLLKVEKKILRSDHKFEINQVVYSSDGAYLATSGINLDTKIHIYDGQTLQKRETIDINGVTTSMTIDPKY
jgi:WD40 repeat protein